MRVEVSDGVGCKELSYGGLHAGVIKPAGEKFTAIAPKGYAKTHDTIQAAIDWLVYQWEK